MKRHLLVRGYVPTLIVAAAVLGGCGWFHRDRVDYYKSAQESRPLEVPPDLDNPTTSKELVVPGTGATTAQPAAGAASAAPPSTASADTGPVDLHVADTVANTYARVGLALDHAQLGKVSGKDDATHSYAYDFDSTVTTQPGAAPAQRHWYSRILHPFGGGDKAQTSAVKSALRVNVSEDANGARISVVPAQGDASGPAAAQRLLATLRERLM